MDRMTFRTSGFALLGLCAALSGCDAPREPASAAAGPPLVTEAWVRLPAVPDRPAAAYFTIRGQGAADTLDAVASDRSKRAEMHETQSHDGKMHMMPVVKVDIPAEGAIAFAPGGRHAMLFDVDPAVRPGDTLKLRLRFQKAGELQSDAQVIAAGDPAPH